MNSDSDESNTEETTNDDLNRPDCVKLRLEEGSDSRRKVRKSRKSRKIRLQAAVQKRASVGETRSIVRKGPERNVNKDGFGGVSFY